MWFMQQGLTMVDVLMRIASVVFIVFLILPLHEYAHGLIAYKLGDNTAKLEGRLTLNPIVSLDPIGALGILLFGFGWARPVPVNPRNFKNPKRDMAVVALAGPVSNLLAATVGGLVYNICVALIRSQVISSSSTAWQWGKEFILYYTVINIGLAVFNLIPIPPLDGSKILMAFLPDKAVMNFYKYQNVIAILLLVLILTGVLSRPLAVAQNFLYKGIMYLTALPFGNQVVF